METNKFNKLIKEKDAQKLINDYMLSKYYFTDNQLQKLIDKRDKEGSSVSKAIAFKKQKRSIRTITVGV